MGLAISRCGSLGGRMEKTINVTPVELEKVLHLLEKAGLKKSDTTLGAASVKELCADAIPFAVEQNGECVSAYAIKVVKHENSTVAWVMAGAGSLEGVDMTATVFPCIEYQAKQLNATQVAVMTKRMGLVKKLESMGYTVTGINLRKKI